MTDPSRRRFHLRERIGVGAYGEVFLAEQESQGGFRRRVALKLLNGELHDRAVAEAARRMRDEARLLGLLSHRNIVSVLDLVNVGGRWAVVMDYIDGPDLDAVLAAARLSGQHVPPPAAFEITAAIASALEAAWRADDGNGADLCVVHRDIKPSNVLLTADGDVKVLDFGVARMSMAAREGRTGALVGTVRYMAPERVLREGDGPAGDVYALGATLAELLTGEPIGPSPLRDERHGEFVEGVIAAVAQTLTGASADSRARALDLLRGALHPDPRERPSSAAIMVEAEALATALPGASLRAFARGFVPRVESLLGRRRTLTSGTLSESSAGTTGEVLTPRGEERSRSTGGDTYAGPAGETLLPLESGVTAMVEPDPPTPRPRRTRVLVGALLAALALGAVAAVLILRPAPTPAVVEPVVQVPSEPALPADLLTPTAPAPPPVAPVAAVAPEPSPPAPITPTPPVAKVEAPPASTSPTDPAPAPSETPEIPPIATVLTPPVAAEITEAPAEPSTPADAQAPDVSGVWVGVAGGRPLTLRLRVEADGAISARAEIAQGATVRSVTLHGGWQDQALALSGQDGETFTGALDGVTLSGRWTSRTGARASSWSATRR